MDVRLPTDSECPAFESPLGWSSDQVVNSPTDVNLQLSKPVTHITIARPHQIVVKGFDKSHIDEYFYRVSI